jgi:hypothetical protein
MERASLCVRVIHCRKPSERFPADIVSRNDAPPIRFRSSGTFPSHPMDDVAFTVRSLTDTLGPCRIKHPSEAFAGGRLDRQDLLERGIPRPLNISRSPARSSELRACAIKRRRILPFVAPTHSGTVKRSHDEKWESDRNQERVVRDPSMRLVSRFALRIQSGTLP